MSDDEPIDAPEAIAVVSMALRVPGADSPDALWEVLREGRETITHFTAEQLRPFELDPERTEQADNYVRAKGVLEGIELFDAEFFHCSPREASEIDPQHRLWLELCWEALERGGFAQRRRDSAVGVFAGAFANHYLLRNLLADRRAVEEYTRGREPSAFAKLIESGSAFMPTRTAYALGLTGPALNVQTACSTSLVAVSMAVQSLLGFECDLALAGGVCIALPQETGYFYQEGAIASRDGHCRPYDAAATGTVFSNGAGVVVLKRLSEALADGDRVLSVIRGAAVNNDGSDKISFTAPSVSGQAAVIASAQALAGVPADSIGYVEGHGTATPMGDPIEVSALTRAFEHSTSRRQFCGLGSIKGNLGHLDAAAGVLGLIKVTLALQHKQLPPTVHFARANPEIRFEDTPFYVVDTLRDWTSDGPRRAGVSSFGIGGTNAHLIVEEAPRQPDCSTPGAHARHLILLSGRSIGALDAMQKALTDHLEARGANLADLSFTLATAREHFEARRALVVDGSPGDLAEQLGKPAFGSSVSGQAGNVGRTLYLFPGQGSGYHGMGRELFQTAPAYRDAVARVCAAAEPLLGAALLPLLDGSASEAEFQTRMDHNAWAQLTVLAVDLGLAALWQSWGVRPDALLGHSLGEWAALCVADVLSVEDTVRAVFERGTLMERFAGQGAAAAVRMAPEALEPLLGVGVSLAAHNSPEACLISGSREAVRDASAALEARGVVVRPLDIRVAVHSPALDAMCEPFGEVLAKLRWSAPQVPIHSTSLGRLLSPEETLDVALWARQARQRVRFSEALSQASSHGPCAVVELGPGRVLTGLVRQHGASLPRHVLINPLAPSSEVDETTQAYAALGRYHCSGGPVDFARYFGDETRQRIELPTYRFQRKRHWVEAHAFDGASSSGSQSRPSGSWPPLPERRSRPPRGDAPRSVIDVVARISGLGLSELPHEARFNDLGFDSLLLVQLSEALATELDLHVPYRSLYDDLSTIALLEKALAARSAGVKVPQPAGVTSHSNLIRLKTDGDRRPIVLVHANYVEKLLPRFVHADQPVLGFFPQGTDGEQVRLTSIEAIASRYLWELCTVQPEGPYTLCGYSFGGVVAYEMACQLRARGEVVAHLILIDTPSPHLKAPEDTRFFPIRQADRLRKALPWVAKRAVARAVATAHIVANRPIPAEQRKGYIMAVFRDATKTYDPGKVDCPVTLYHASRSEFVETDRGWRALVTGPFRTVEVEGDHESIPESQTLSRKIAELLDGQNRSPERVEPTTDGHAK